MKEWIENNKNSKLVGIIAFILCFISISLCWLCAVGHGELINFIYDKTYNNYWLRLGIIGSVLTNILGIFVSHKSLMKYLIKLANLKRITKERYCYLSKFQGRITFVVSLIVILLLSLSIILSFINVKMSAIMLSIETLIGGCVGIMAIFTFFLALFGEE